MEKDNFRKNQRKKNRNSHTMLIVIVYVCAFFVIAGAVVTALLLHKPSVDPTPQFPTDGITDLEQTTDVATEPEDPYT